MAGTTFIVGRDAQAVIVWNGQTLTLPDLTEISITPKFKTVTSDPLNSPPLQRMLPNGHDIKIMFDRADAVVETIQANAEAGFWASGTAAGGTSPTNTMALYINEVNGSQTIRNYQNVAFALTNAGSFTPENPVKMEITGFASTMSVT